MITLHVWLAQKSAAVDQAAGALASDYATSLLQVLLVLAVTAALAYGSLRFGAARGLFPSARGKLLQVEESVRIDAKSSLVIVRVEGRRLLLATHAQGAPQLLVELGASAPEPASQAGREP
jgi:flagellar biogenesis protein FliO